MSRLFSILFLLAWLIFACAPATTPAHVQVTTDAPVQAPTQASQPAASNALFQIVKADGEKFAVTLDALKALPLAQITVDGKVQEGPKLIDILALAGVTDFTEVLLTGSSSPVALTRVQVDDNTILDFTNRGTVKLATTYIPMPDWTKDISEITVK